MTIMQDKEDKNQIEYEPQSRTIDEIMMYVSDNRLNLNPGFQRKSVWGIRDQQKLIDSILHGYPLPAIFLYQREDEKSRKVVFDVIDGKQRLEAIFKFLKNEFSVKNDDMLCGIDNKKYKQINYALLKKLKVENDFNNNYKLNTITVSGDFGAIIDLFVRINSTGKPLTSSEKDSAKYFRSKFLQAAYKLAAVKFRKQFEKNKIFSENDVSRMKDVGFMCDFMYAVYTKGVCDKTQARNNAFGDLTDDRSVARVAKDSAKTLRKIFKMFPELRTTRFKKISDFYCLCVLIYQYMFVNKLALEDKKKNALAFELLKDLSVGVGLLSEKKHKKTPNDGIYAEYLSTVSHATDSLSQRKKRIEILDSFLSGIFEKKADKRIFTPTQRIIIWHSSEDKCCAKCGKRLTWDNFTVDHIKPYSKGGATSVLNAALMCRSCNSKKGNR